MSPMLSLPPFFSYNQGDALAHTNADVVVDAVADVVADVVAHANADVVAATDCFPTSVLQPTLRHNLRIAI